MRDRLQTQEEAASWALTFLELEDPYKVLYLEGRYNPLYWTYTLREVKPDEDGWLFRFWRISDETFVEPPFGNLYVYRATGEAEFRDHGYVQTEAEAIALAQAFTKEVEDHRDMWLKRRYKHAPEMSENIKLTYTLREVKPYDEGWLFQFDRSVPRGEISPSETLIYVNQKTGDVRFRNYG